MKQFEQLRLELKGMTVNERLHTCGLYEQWHIAVLSKDEAAMKAVLLKTFLTKDQVNETVKMVLRKPQLYGF